MIFQAPSLCFSQTAINPKSYTEGPGRPPTSIHPYTHTHTHTFLALKCLLQHRKDVNKESTKEISEKAQTQQEQDC